MSFYFNLYNNVLYDTMLIMTKQILIKKLKIIKNHINKMKIIDELVRKDTRGLLFIVEGILRLYTKYATLNHQDEIKLTEAFNFIKKIEDMMGQAFFYKEMHDYYLTNFQEKLPALEIDKNQKLEKLFQFLKSSQFEEEFIKVLNSIEEVKFQKDKFIVKSIIKEIKRIDKKIEYKLSSLIEKDKYGFHELEEGVHEWRRMIRWVALYLQGHKHLFALKLKKKHRNEDIVKKYKDNKFCILSNGPYLINAKAYYMLSDFIVKVGNLKTQAEILYFLKTNYKVKIVSPLIEKDAQSRFKCFKKSKVLKKII
jgi:hypothetical protein